MSGVGRLILAILLMVVVATGELRAHPDHAFGKPLHAASLEEARSLAAEEYRIVFVYVSDPQGEPPRYFVRPDWDDWTLMDLLVRECVGILAMGQQAGEIIQHYEVTKLPAVLLLNDDGSERTRFAVPLTLRQLIERLKRDLSDSDTVQRIHRAAGDESIRKMYVRERLAQALTRTGDYAEACREYMWCLNDGLPQDLSYASARRRLFLRGFRELTEVYPPALQALEEWRKTREQIIRDDPDDHDLARNWAAVNACLHDPERTLELYDVLPERSKARHILFAETLPVMIEKGRYLEVLDRVDPLREFRQDCTFARMRGRPYNEGDGAELERGTRSYASARAASLVEALAGVGRYDEAAALTERILKFYDNRRVRSWLEDHIRRSGDLKLEKHLRALTKEKDEPAP